MRKRIGYILMGIAVLHEVVGIVFYGPVLVEILRDGFFNTINPLAWERDAAFWFLMFGVMLFLMGWAGQWTLEKVGYIPSFLSSGVLLVCLVGVMMMPTSGFWLGIPVALVMLRLGQSNTEQPQNRAEKAT